MALESAVNRDISWSDVDCIIEFLVIKNSLDTDIICSLKNGLKGD